jgi:WD40 repeat protein
MGRESAGSAGARVAKVAFVYRAFMSYSHAADGRLAAALQRGLQRIGKPWYRRPVIKVFRDETSLSASPELWAEIERNLARSEFFILMASVQAAGSPWVRREVQWWLENRPREKILIAVTGGGIAWEPGASDFDWGRTTCLPPGLRGCFPGEPLYVDLRWATGKDDLSLRHAKFRDAVITLAAPLHGRPKDELDSEEIRQHRRFRLAAGAAAVLLNVLALISFYYFWTARQETARAEVSWRDAESRRLAAVSLEKLEAEQNIDDAIKIAVMAWKLAPTDEAGASLQKIEQASSEVARILGRHTGGVAAVAFSPDSTLLATMGRDGSILPWRVGTWAAAAPLLAGTLRDAEGLHFDGTGSHLVVWTRDGAMERWELSSRTKRAIDGFQRPGARLWSVAPSADGSLIAVGGEAGLLAVWDAKSGARRRAPVDLGDGTVKGVHFGPDGRLRVLHFRYGQMRAGIWDIASGTMSLGPASREAHFLSYVDQVSFNGAGTRFVVTGDGAGMLVEIDQGLALRELNPLGGRPLGDRVALDSEGRTLFRQTSEGWERWDLTSTPAMTAKGQTKGARWVRMTWSPDGRWRADLDREKILVWDLGAAPTAGPVTSIAGRCEFRRSGGECVRRLCEKILPGLDEEQLRKLFGIQNYEVIYDRFKAAIRGSLCDRG